MTSPAETAVVCDSTAYLPSEMLAERGVAVISLYVYGIAVILVVLFEPGGLAAIGAFVDRETEIELALAGNAAAIVTHNVRDVNRGDLQLGNLRILTPAQFLEALK